MAWGVLRCAGDGPNKSRTRVCRMQVWESDASEHLAFGSDAGAKECEPDGQGQAAAGKRERGCRAEKRRGDETR